MATAVSIFAPAQVASAEALLGAMDAQSWGDQTEVAQAQLSAMMAAESDDPQALERVLGRLQLQALGRVRFDPTPQHLEAARVILAAAQRNAKETFLHADGVRQPPFSAIAHDGFAQADVVVPAINVYIDGRVSHVWDFDQLFRLIERAAEPVLRALNPSPRRWWQLWGKPKEIRVEIASIHETKIVIEAKSAGWPFTTPDELSITLHHPAQQAGVRLPLGELRTASFNRGRRETYQSFSDPSSPQRAELLLLAEEAGIQLHFVEGHFLIDATNDADFEIGSTQTQDNCSWLHIVLPGDRRGKYIDWLRFFLNTHRAALAETFRL